MPCNLAERAETIASSDMANTPFNAISANKIAASIQGKGVGFIELALP
jgi:hypothetical protein